MNNFYKQAITQTKKMIDKIESAEEYAVSTDELKGIVDLIEAAISIDKESVKKCSHKNVIPGHKWISPVHIRISAMCKECGKTEAVEVEVESGIGEEEEKMIIFDLEKKLRRESV
jgi:hypothetical protein